MATMPCIQARDGQFVEVRRLRAAHRQRGQEQRPRGRHLIRGAIPALLRHPMRWEHMAVDVTEVAAAPNGAKATRVAVLLGHRRRAAAGHSKRAPSWARRQTAAARSGAAAARR
jgi:hypothetical protein